MCHRFAICEFADVCCSQFQFFSCTWPLNVSFSGVLSRMASTVIPRAKLDRTTPRTLRRTLSAIASRTSFRPPEKSGVFFCWLLSQTVDPNLQESTAVLSFYNFFHPPFLLSWSLISDNHTNYWSLCWIQSWLMTFYNIWITQEAKSAHPGPSCTNLWFACCELYTCGCCIPLRKLATGLCWSIAGHWSLLPSCHATAPTEAAAFGEWGVAWCSVPSQLSAKEQAHRFAMICQCLCYSLIMSYSLWLFK